MIWVWTTKAAAAGVSVRARITTARHIDAPAFTVCPSASGASCKIGSLPVGQADELQATVRVLSAATGGEHVHLSAKASASGATSFTGSATTTVVAATTPTPVSSSTGPGVAISLPAPSTLPPLTGTGVSATDPAGLFPTVKSSPTPSSTSLGLPPAKSRPKLHAAEAASTVPLDSRLIGGQLAGLAVLAGAVAIAIARLSLRTPKTRDEDPKQPPRS